MRMRNIRQSARTVTIVLCWTKSTNLKQSTAEDENGVYI